MIITMTYLLICVVALAAFGIGYSVGCDTAPRRIRLERERCARLALAIVPRGDDVVGRRGALAHAMRIRAAILGIDPPVRRTTTAAETAP